MSQQDVLDIALQGIIVAMKLAAPALLSIMIMGLLISILQAATQINEQTLSFIPKMIAMTVALILAGPWILKVITIFTQDVFNNIQNITE